MSDARADCPWKCKQCLCYEGEVERVRAEVERVSAELLQARGVSVLLRTEVAELRAENERLTDPTYLEEALTKSLDRKSLEVVEKGEIERLRSEVERLKGVVEQQHRDFANQQADMERLRAEGKG